jgi:hypothetical protein
MNDMNTRCAGQAPADRLQERRRRAPRRAAGLTPEGVAMAKAAVARMERGEFDDQALAAAVAADSATSA